MIRNILKIISLSCVLFVCSQCTNNPKAADAKENKTMHQLIVELMKLDKNQTQAFMQLYTEEFILFMDKESISNVIDGKYILSVKERKKIEEECRYLIYLSDARTGDTIKVIPISFIDEN